MQLHVFECQPLEERFHEFQLVLESWIPSFTPWLSTWLLSPGLAFKSTCRTNLQDLLYGLLIRVHRTLQSHKLNFQWLMSMKQPDITILLDCSQLNLNSSQELLLNFHKYLLSSWQVFLKTPQDRFLKSTILQLHHTLLQVNLKPQLHLHLPSAIFPHEAPFWVQNWTWYFLSKSQRKI